MRSFALLLTAALVCAALPAAATDVDGPDDCQRTIRDFGDAPEGVPAYPGPVLGNFPTCIVPGAVGTQVFACPPISPPPGPTGFVTHLNGGAATGGNFWLGCYLNAIGFYGIDTEPDGKTNSPAIGVSACSGIPTDCVEAAFGMTFDQDECFADGSDAGVTRPTLLVCRPGTVAYSVWNCGPTRQAFLNICVDFDTDGDWNDNFLCPGGGCAYEWAVVNAPIILAPGCTPLVSPPFLVGPKAGPAWMRVSISTDPMPPDYPWNGTVAVGGVRGGETEDYPILIDNNVGTAPSTWGNMKTLYR
jgi:hypothetical protein